LERQLSAGSLQQIGRHQSQLAARKNSVNIASLQMRTCLAPLAAGAALMKEEKSLEWPLVAVVACAALYTRGEHLIQ
jgi:hypothetical protein